MNEYDDQDTLLLAGSIVGILFWIWSYVLIMGCMHEAKTKKQFLKNMLIAAGGPVTLCLYTFGWIGVALWEWGKEFFQWWRDLPDDIQPKQ